MLRKQLQVVTEHAEESRGGGGIQQHNNPFSNLSGIFLQCSNSMSSMCRFTSELQSITTGILDCN